MSTMINDSICSLDAQFVVGIYTVVIYAPLAAIYVIVAILFIKHPNAFHPLFVLSFFLILLSYTTSHFILFFRNLLEFLIDRNFLFDILEYIFVYANYYTQPIVLLALMERLAATIWVSSYENSRYWVPYFFGQLLCIGLVVLMSIYENEEELIGKIQFLLSIIICIFLIVLFFVNRKKTENANSRLSLTTRYQLAENIKALRVFVPFLVLTNVISVMFAITDNLLNVARKFDEEECKKRKSYVPQFVVLRTIAIIIQISMAVLVIYQHESMKFWRSWRRSNRTQEASISMSKAEDHLQIRNVLGKNISGHENIDTYFSQLKSQWGK